MIKYYFGSVYIKCPYCGALALCSPSKGIWCEVCKNGTVKKGIQ